MISACLRGLLLVAVLLGPAAIAEEKAAAPGSVIYPRAAEPPPATATGTASGYNTVLLAALALAGAGGWLFWRARTVTGAAALRKLSIAETKSLGNRQFLVVACYDEKKFLLGVCPGRIDLLTPLEGGPPAADSP